MRNLRQRVAVTAIGLMLAVAGCGEEESFGRGDVSGSGSDSESTATVTAAAEDATPTPTPLGHDAALRQDAAIYAEEQGISVDEAVERLEWQGELGSLGAAIEANEPDTFAGAFIEHEPEYRFVVLFTRDGEETIQKYVEEGSELDEIVEVRTARYTYVELQDAQAEAGRLLEDIGNASSSINVFENQVEIYVHNTEQAEEMLEGAGIVLPESVALIDNDGAPVSYDAPDPVPGIYFALEKPSLGPSGQMDALMTGELVVRDGCLMIESGSDDALTLPIWPYDHRLRAEGDTVEVLNGNGEVVARVGEPVNLGGGEVPVDVDTRNEYLHEPIPENCQQGSYWSVGGTYPLGTGPGAAQPETDIPVPTEVTDFPPVPEREAPMGLDAVKWPDDPDAVKALLDAMPEELDGLELDPWEGPVEAERAQISYGPDDEFGLPRLTIIDLTSGSFFPPEWTADELISYEITSGDPLDAGRDGAVVWARSETTENGVPLQTIQWGQVGSTWMFAAGAGDQATLEQLVAAAIDAAGSE